MHFDPSKLSLKKTPKLGNLDNAFNYVKGLHIHLSEKIGEDHISSLSSDRIWRSVVALLLIIAFVGICQRLESRHTNSRAVSSKVTNPSFNDALCYLSWYCITNTYQQVRSYK